MSNERYYGLDWVPSEFICRSLTPNVTVLGDGVQGGVCVSHSAVSDSL